MTRERTASLWSLPLPGRCLSQPRFKGLLPPFLNFRMLKPFTLTLIFKLTTGRFGHLPFQFSTMSACLSKDIALTCSHFDVLLPNARSAAGLQVFTACSIPFWMTILHRLPILFTFRSRWRFYQNLIGRPRAHRLSQRDVHT